MWVMKSWIDVSIPLRHAMMHWPDNPPVAIERVHDMDRGDGNTISHPSLGSHTGTHMDAPAHFIRKDTGIDKMPLDAVIGRARVIEIKDSKCIKPEELTPYYFRRGERSSTAGIGF
jgi:arylformamidase